MNPGSVLPTRQHLPGLLVCAAMALVATFLSRHYGGPQLLYALLIGLACHFLAARPGIRPGVDYCARTVLRLGVALLGARITVEQVSALGWATAGTVVAAVLFTVALGLLLSRWLDRPAAEGFLSGGAVAICGASAALAVASVLPPTRDNERFTLLVVVGVTVLSTVAMVVYPFALQALALTPVQSGIVIGGTIHDVAQVVAAGMMLGPAAGDVATVVKLLRVMLLMPVVLLVALALRSTALASQRHTPAAERVPWVPGFLLAFVALVLLGSAGLLPAPVRQAASEASGWLLVAAIAGAGIKTRFEDLLQLGWRPVFMLVSETLFIAALVLGAVWTLGLGT